MELNVVIEEKTKNREQLYFKEVEEYEPFKYNIKLSIPNKNCKINSILTLSLAGQRGSETIYMIIVSSKNNKEFCAKFKKRIYRQYFT